MNVQNYLLCILYIILILAHSFTLCQKNFHRNLISIFSFALFTETTSTILETIYQTVSAHGQKITELTNLDLSPLMNFHYFAQLIHITAINFFILFLLIVAKGWPITRRDIPFKYAFAIFWIICLLADLMIYYWTTITVIAKNISASYNTTMIFDDVMDSKHNSSLIDNPQLQDKSNETRESVTATSLTNLTASIIESLPKDQEQFNTTPGRLSLLLRIIIMLYFLLELRTTMILEREKKKLQFYLHFGALTMVWFVHTIIVYVISLRVDSSWQSKLISGFSSAANFLGFAVTTRLLWPKYSRSHLFQKQSGATRRSLEGGCEIDNFSTFDADDRTCAGDHEEEEDDDGGEDEKDGLKMRDLSKTRKNGGAHLTGHTKL